MRAVVDQDITPTERLLEGLPVEWTATVGLQGEPAAVVAALDGVAVAFVTSRITLSRDVIEALPELRLIAKLGTGIDNVDLQAAAEHDIAVTYTPGHNALSVAEHTLGLLLATARRHTEGRAILEGGGWRDEATLGTRLSGKTIGIVGYGNVGRRVGQLLAGFHVELLVADPYIPSIDAELGGGELLALPELLERSDAVIVTAALTEETRGLIGAEELARMKDTAILVNTARGPIVDPDALLHALRSGELAGAGLDVFATEPLGADSPLLALDTVVATPHVAAMTTESRTETIDRLVENARAILAGESVPSRYLATPD